MKKVLIALAFLAVAVSALAELSAKYKDWDKSPEAYFLTPAERSEWKSVQTDEEAQKFIATYFAERGGDAFHEALDRRIAAADEQFKMRRQKGSESARGRVFIVLGNPSRVLQSRPTGATDVSATADTGLVGGPTPELEIKSKAQIWIYEAGKFDPSWGIGELTIHFEVNEQRGSDGVVGQLDQAQVDKAIMTVAEKSIVHPEATAATASAGKAAPPAAAAPSAAAGGAAAPAGSTAGPAAAAGAPPIMALPAEVKTALEGVTGSGAGEASFWAGTFRSAAGDFFLALQFYLPSNKPAFASGAPLKFGALVTNAAGETVDSFWEDATFREVAEAGRKDRVFDSSIVVPPGEYKGSFGLFAAEGQPPVTAAAIDFKIEPKSDDFTVSPLILSSGLVPLTKRPGPTDPFVFGTDKPIRVEPKGDHQFSKQDSLWYFYTVSNAATPGGAAPAPTPAAEAAGGTAAPAAPAAEAPRPRIMTKINVQKDGQDAFAPFTAPADLQQVNTGIWGTGSEIPLASFSPGYYTFIITVRDLNAARGTPPNKGVERKQDFVVLMPDGSPPPKTEAKAPAKPAAKPKKP